jgi:hypothetical protein
MFAIELILDIETVTGLKALDIRRRLGLKDDSILSRVYTLSRNVTVGEGFARRYFKLDQRKKSVIVDPQLLQKGDVVLDDRNQMTWNQDITDERVVELFIAVSTV